MLLRARCGEEAVEAPVSAVGVDRLIEAAREARSVDADEAAAVAGDVDNCVEARCAA
jgi:hypothetical protein